MAYRLALRRIRPLLRAVAIFVVMWVALTSTVVLIPLALWFAVRWALLAPVTELEGRGGATRCVGAGARPRPLASRRLARRPRRRARPPLGPLLGALLIVVSSSSLAVLNLVAGIVYAVALPFVALVTCYVYFDARTRHELEPRERSTSCPPRSRSIRPSPGVWRRGSPASACPAPPRPPPARGPWESPRTSSRSASRAAPP